MLAIPNRKEFPGDFVFCVIRAQAAGNDGRATEEPLKSERHGTSLNSRARQESKKQTL